jgi:lysophospholipase L1-like esterase
MLPANLRYLALGDSYTFGVLVPKDQRWPDQLVRELEDAGYPISHLRLIAQNGWTTSDLLTALGRVEFTSAFNLVSLLIGVNNQYQGLGANHYRHEFRLLLQRAVDLAGGDLNRVMVLSIPDWAKTPFAEGRDRVKIRAEIQQFNAINRHETLQVGANYINITPITQNIGTGPSWLVEDQLHPSGKMYAAWVELVAPVALKILGDQPDHQT